MNLPEVAILLFGAVMVGAVVLGVVMAFHSTFSGWIDPTQVDPCWRCRGVRLPYFSTTRCPECGRRIPK